MSTASIPFTPEERAYALRVFALIVRYFAAQGSVKYVLFAKAIKTLAPPTPGSYSDEDKNDPRLLYAGNRVICCLQDGIDEDACRRAKRPGWTMQGELPTCVIAQDSDPCEIWIRPALAAVPGEYTPLAVDFSREYASQVWEHAVIDAEEDFQSSIEWLEDIVLRTAPALSFIYKTERRAGLAQELSAFCDAHPDQATAFLREYCRMFSIDIPLRRQT